MGGWWWGCVQPSLSSLVVVLSLSCRCLVVVLSLSCRCLVLSCHSIVQLYHFHTVVLSLIALSHLVLFSFFPNERYTIETSKGIDEAFFEQAGCRPHLILSLLHRIKMDPNRPVEEVVFLSSFSIPSFVFRLVFLSFLLSFFLSPLSPVSFSSSFPSPLVLILCLFPGRGERLVCRGWERVAIVTPLFPMQAVQHPEAEVAYYEFHGFIEVCLCATHPPIHAM